MIPMVVNIISLPIKTEYCLKRIVELLFQKVCIKKIQLKYTVLSYTLYL
jgi:hypothetical protein